MQKFINYIESHISVAIILICAILMFYMGVNFQLFRARTTEYIIQEKISRIERANQKISMLYIEDVFQRCNCPDCPISVRARLYHLMVDLDNEWNTLGILAQRVTCPIQQQILNRNIVAITPRSTHLQRRYPHVSRFYPLDDPKFYEVVNSSEFGRITLNYFGKDMLVYFQWIPSTSDEQYLCIVGILPANIAGFDYWFVSGIFSFVLLIIFLVYLQIGIFRKKLSEK